MRSSPALSVDRWSQPCWEVRVRGTREAPTFLWGSGGVTRDVQFTRPLILHVHNDVFGEEITIGVQTATGQQTIFGTLQPGEAISLPMQAISGVFGTCELESTVWCLIKYTD